MMKRVDVAVYNIIKAESEGHFTWGNKYFGLADRGIDYAMDQYNEKLISSDMKAKIEKVRSEILSGKIKVSDYYITRSLCPDSPLKCDRSPRPTTPSGRPTQ
jgi:basic membrane protein A